MEQKNDFKERMVSDEVLHSVLKYYAAYTEKTSSVGAIQKFSETKNGFKGLGISLNSVLFTRSIRAIQSDNYSLDINHLYIDLKDEANWREVPALDDYFFDRTDIFDRGISLEDGLIFGLEGKWLGKTPDAPFEFEGTKLYKNRIIAGTANEFFSIMFRLFGYDTHMALDQLLTHRGVGAGTTTQVCEQYLGALIAGPYCDTRQYRLRKTKISEDLDIGHVLVKRVELKDELSKELTDAGFVFRRALNPVNSLNSINNELVDCFNRIPCKDRYKSPAQLFDINETLIYADIIDQKKRIIVTDRINDSVRTEDITELINSI